MVPKKVAQSQNVAEYMPQAEGMKSRVRLTTTITKRSSHMPVFTTIESKNRSTVLVRILWNHSNCGTMMLHRMSDQ